MKRSVAVLGAGITGLTAARALARAGAQVRVFEAGTRAGGVIGSECVDGWLVESGPNSLLAAADSLRFLVELGMEGETIAASQAARHRYIVKEGRLEPLPLSPVGLLRSRLLPAASKIALGRELFFKAGARDGDVSVAALMAEHFGPDIVEYAVRPFVSGIYAGEAGRLSARHAFPKVWEMERAHGSLIRGQTASARQRRRRGEAKPRILSFRGGMQALIDRLVEQVKARQADALLLDSTVERILPGPPATVVWRTGGGVRAERFDAVIAALPAAALSRLVFGNDAARPLESLAGIASPPVAALFLGYRREQVAHALDGFGALVPPAERRSILGVLFSSTLFPGRAPEGHVALTVMLGGVLQPGLGRLNAAEALAASRRDLAELLGVSGEPVFVRHRSWPQAIPQYDLGFEKHLATMESCEKAHPGFFIGGAARDGVSVPDCIRSGQRLAERALQ